MTNAFWVTGPLEGVIREATFDHYPPAIATEENPAVDVQALYSGISRGTEALVFANRVPESEFQTMRAPFQEGDFPFPVKYGYSSVGRVTSGPEELAGRSVFCLFPHQTHYRVPASAVVPLPEGLPEGRAVLAANMETAVNGLWDAAPRIGDRIAVVGLGVVGLLVAWLASRIPGTRVTALDTNPGRRAVAECLGLDFRTHCQQDDHDLVIHASGHPAGLETALGLAGMEARIVEMSWYGAQTVPLPLGHGFHSRRLSIRSSQVGHLNPLQLPRWQYRDRMALALDLLKDEVLDNLISGESPFESLPGVMAALAGVPGSSHAGPIASDSLCHRIVYNRC
ncbi:zinc-dependent alcohol dehydrogenase [Marinobacter orientalis]|uniref:Zinc-binding alcohol dehydrogenase n=1 Tax=Marinobacter orientalis TaxID=1928859 RepID=A0A7Y0WSF2_9GAMM|nr:zinc-binding alcohol dehydrogenase [Marinobacter orientalis]NMT63834.1 zinc-binding alcohol dehydrogenase [Marinobacter orientalis]TGX49936.1 zinc-binding alcohol dehydrogenase [Marinobacter orientalis]